MEGAVCHFGFHVCPPYLQILELVIIKEKRDLPVLFPPLEDVFAKRTKGLMRILPFEAMPSCQDTEMANCRDGRVSRL